MPNHNYNSNFGERFVVDPKKIGQRIQTVRGIMTATSFAKKIGVSHTSVHAFEKGERVPDINTLIRIAMHGKVDIGFLILGRPFPEQINSSRVGFVKVRSANEKVSNKSKIDLKKIKYCSIPLTSEDLAASKKILQPEDLIDQIMVKASMVEKIGSLGDIVACRLSGESMEPFVYDGDIAIINRDININAIMDNKVYALYDGKKMTVSVIRDIYKKMFLFPVSGRGEVREFNPKDDDFKLVGILVSIWRNINK